jgi:L-asparaginase
MQTSPLALLIIYTGGTIGMQNSAEGYKPSAGIQALIENALSTKALQQLQPFKVLEFDHLIDSSNAQPNDWLSIGQCIDKHYQQYAGFIVLHGTDTMAYTAAALHHMLGSNIKPVIVTGSQIPMHEARSDASNNILEAALVARSKKVRQVCLSFSGRLLAGNSAKKVHTSALAAFDSPNRPALATTGIKLNFCKETQHNDQAINSQFNFSLMQANSVAVLMLYPGISKESIEGVFSNQNTKAVIMLSYGAGNPPDQNIDLINALRRAQKNNILLFNMTQCHLGAVSQGSYAVGSVLNKLGVISAQDRTLEDLVTDLYVNFSDYKT